MFLSCPPRCHSFHSLPWIHLRPRSPTHYTFPAAKKPASQPLGLVEQKLKWLHHRYTCRISSQPPHTHFAYAFDIPGTIMTSSSLTPGDWIRSCFRSMMMNA
ncbi:hypothetical protein AG1IA_05264 [Rhizoctonia solani AG-1 IA]|uniref:Uncharacterized protein n=1 Tax=Thanatephorus cucumeris (strain AG1-IA) TaxID=983506 RepID=L8WRD0_THACA|nr:hypothetical protein AG1IA_05264 [Rhizoctonia solani AG-1 IA]